MISSVCRFLFKSDLQIDKIMDQVKSTQQPYFGKAAIVPDTEEKQSYAGSGDKSRFAGIFGLHYLTVNFCPFEAVRRTTRFSRLPSHNFTIKINKNI